MRNKIWILIMVAIATGCVEKQPKLSNTESMTLDNCNTDVFVDAKNQGIEGDSSGVIHHDNHLWIVNNGLSRVFKMKLDGCKYIHSPADKWGCRGGNDDAEEPANCGKKLLFKDGKGRPDAEGITIVPEFKGLIFVASEKDNRKSNTSRPSVLLYDTTVNVKDMTALQEWNLADKLPKVRPNKGLEGIAWVSDETLVNNKFTNWRNELYVPSKVPHYGGLFFISLEDKVVDSKSREFKTPIYLFALYEGDQAAPGNAEKIAEIQTERYPFVGLEFDAHSEKLWATCDDGCSRGKYKNATRVFSLTGGKFVATGELPKPSKMVKSNYEGIAFSSCEGDTRNVFWVDDSGENGEVIFHDKQAC